jgi:hypothetical protein
LYEWTAQKTKKLGWGWGYTDGPLPINDREGHTDNKVIS